MARMHPSNANSRAHAPCTSDVEPAGMSSERSLAGNGMLRPSRSWEFMVWTLGGLMRGAEGNCGMIASGVHESSGSKWLRTNGQDTMRAHMWRHAVAKYPHGDSSGASAGTQLDQSGTPAGTPPGPAGGRRTCRTRVRRKYPPPRMTRAQLRMHVTHDTNTENDFPVGRIHTRHTPPTSDVQGYPAGNFVPIRSAPTRVPSGAPTMLKPPSGTAIGRVRSN